MNNRICSELITNLYTSTIPALYDEIKKIKSDKKAPVSTPSDDNVSCGCNLTMVYDQIERAKQHMELKIDAYSNLYDENITNLQRDVATCFEHCDDIRLLSDTRMDDYFTQLSNRIGEVDVKAAEERKLMDDKLEIYHTYCDDYRQRLDDKIETYYSDINSSIAEVSERVTMYHSDPAYSNEDRLQKIEKDVEELGVKITELQSVLFSLTSRGADHNR